MPGARRGGVAVAFCDYCTCQTCMDGEEHLSHALTTDDRWICDVCYWYELCLDEKRLETGKTRGHDPCSEEHCAHRPQLASNWIKFGE